MYKHLIVLSALVCVMGLTTGVTMAADQEQLHKQEQVYGSQLMTSQERAEHQAKMRSLKTNEEREAYRERHHVEMQQRARERGQTLPDMQPGQRRGMGPGAGGKGSGGGGSRR